MRHWRRHPASWGAAFVLAVTGVATAAVATTLTARSTPDSPPTAGQHLIVSPSASPAPSPRRCASRVPRKPTVFGVSLRTAGRTATEALANEEQKFGNVRVVRLFNPSLPPRDVWTSPETVVAGVNVVISFRASPRAVLSGRLDDALTRFFADAPRQREVYWTYNHEPEQEIAQHEYTAAAYRAAWRHITRLSRRACNSRLHATLILTGFTANPYSHRDWRTYYPGSRWIDVLGWDVYNRANRTPTRYEDPLTLFGTLTVIAQDAHKPLAITEMGSARVASDTTGDGRADWLGLCAAFLAQQKAVLVVYFDSTRNGDFLLDDQPSITEWRRWVRRR